jgi:hypothetical protein
MRVWCVCIVVLSLASAAQAGAGDEDVRNRLKSGNYTVTWGNVADYDAKSELEIGDGNGHGGTLAWLRFQPGADAVHVLSVRLDDGRLDDGRKVVLSKWPSDRVAVSVKRARMQKDNYARLLRDLALIDSARLTPLDAGWGWSSNDFWVYSRVIGKGKVLQDLDWSGYYREH